MYLRKLNKEGIRMTEEIKKSIIIKRKIKLPEQSEKVETQLKCNKIDCEEKDCSHYNLHDKLRTCKEVCGVHQEAKCI